MVYNNLKKLVNAISPLSVVILLVCSLKLLVLPEASADVLDTDFDHEVVGVVEIVADVTSVVVVSCAIMSCWVVLSGKSVEHFVNKMCLASKRNLTVLQIPP